jgi:lysophospholipase L1-like esterase
LPNECDGPAKGGPTGRRQILGLGCAIAAGSSAAASDAAVPTEPVRLREEQTFLARYRGDNERLRQEGVSVRCVFMGDSITERWATTRRSFFSPGRVCRGIIGQTTPEMLLRFRRDVVELDPIVVHIMGGTNDIAGNTGPASPREIAANIMSMTEIALANGIRVVIASVLPAAAYPWRPGVRPVEPTRELNAILREYAARIGAVYADYFPHVSDERGGMRPGFAIGEVHPTDAGYQAMEPVAEKAIEQAMKLPLQGLRHSGLRGSGDGPRVSHPGQQRTGGILFGPQIYGTGAESDSVVLSALGWPAKIATPKK